jgi:hypothetical protein
MLERSIARAAVAVSGLVMLATVGFAAGGAPSESGAAPSPLGETQPLFDPADIPPTEALGAAPDFRALSAADASADMTRAALRRAWSTDPEIRDFIGLSENSWDFNAPGGVPGFDAVTVEDIRPLAPQLSGNSEAPDLARAAAVTSPSDSPRNLALHATSGRSIAK